MKFICKGCGEETEINIFSKEIFGCWCDSCGRKMPRRKNFVIINCLYYCALPLLLHLMVEWACYKDTNLWFVMIITLLVTSITFYSLWILGMWIEGRRLPKAFVGEEQEWYSVDCPGCGKELRISQRAVLEGEKVECIDCKNVFDLQRDESIDDVERWISVFRTILFLVLVLGGFILLRGEDISAHHWIFSSLPILLFSCIESPISNRILWHYYRKRRKPTDNANN